MMWRCDSCLMRTDHRTRGFGQHVVRKENPSHQVMRVKMMFTMLGVCLGMQLTCIESLLVTFWCEGANSPELAPDTKYPIIIMRDQVDVEDMGGTLRLELYPSKLKRGS